MLWTTFVILLILWLLGLVSGYTMGGVIHILLAKTLVIDGVWSTVGSTNMDFWSFSTNDEVNAVILSREFAMEMEKMFARELAESDQIRWEEWEKRSSLSKVRERFYHSFSHWALENQERGRRFLLQFE